MFHFITRIARQYDATASVKAGKLLVVPRGGQAKSVSGKAIPLLVLHRADIKSWRYTLSDWNESGGVAVKSHNKKTGKTLEIIVPDKDNPSAPLCGLPAILCPAQLGRGQAQKGR